MKVSLPYVRIKRGKLFWTPSPAMRAAGFVAKPLGAGPEALGEAKRLHDAWRAHLAARGGPPPCAWPAGSLGHYLTAMKRTARWAKLKPRTHEDYDRAEVHLAAAGLLRKTLTRISVDDCERLADGLQARRGAHERYRTIKALRAIFADAIPRLQLVGFPNPAKAFPNPQPAGRSAIWLGAEVPVLVATAEAEGYAGMAIAIRVAWETLFSPVDVWTLILGALHEDAGGAWAERSRTKTAKAAYGHLSADTWAAIAAYLKALPFKIPAEGALVRQRNGHAYRSKDTFGDDFRAVRAVAFPGDTRQFQDLRRSGNVEADAAGADKATMAELLANTIDRNGALDEVYTPPTVAKARHVAALRLKGRKRLAGELTRIRSKG
jgi:hypothetical protein